MAAGSAQFHEDPELLSDATRDRHRATVSLMEELEAADWYDQRLEATSDSELKSVLEHNRDEEKEHAAMLLEWLRRNDRGWAAVLQRYLFTKGPLIEIEESADGNGGDASLGIGDLKKGGL